MALSRYGGITGSVHINEDFENVNKAFNNVAAENDVNKGVVDNHLTSNSAHSAAQITYGNGSVEDELESQDERINNIVSQSGDDITELVDARQPQSGSAYPTLKARLDSEHGNLAAQLADLTNNTNSVRINVKYPPPPLVGAKGGGVIDDTDAFKAVIAALPPGGILEIPPDNYKLSDELTVTKPIRIVGAMAEDMGRTYLDFNLDDKASTKVAIRVNAGVHGCVFEGFYVNYSGIANRNGIVLDGKGLDYANAVWHTKFNGVYARGFADNFKCSNICIASFNNCRSINAKENGFNQTDFATGLTYYSCYAQDSIGDGFKFSTAYYSGCFSSYSDGNARGFHFSASHGVFVRDCGSESCQRYAVSCQNSSLNVDGITTVESGVLQASIYHPTIVYVESGHCNIKNVVEERLHPSNTRLYTILFEAGASGNIETTGKELLDIYIPYDGSCSVDNQFFSEGLPTKTGWKPKDIGKVVYNKNATEQGSSPNKYIIFGYRRMTAGNGNVIGTDWLPLRALTGN